MISPRIVRSCVGLVGFLTLWEGAVRLGLVERTFLPTPTDVLSALARLIGDRPFVLDVIATTLAWLIAVLVTVGIAVPTG